MFNIKKYKSTISFILVLVSFISLLWGFFNTYNKTITTLNKTQQIALKSLIWNESVPLIERIEMCDEYVSLGYNSYTKKYCESILK